MPQPPDLQETLLKASRDALAEVRTQMRRDIRQTIADAYDEVRTAREIALDADAARVARQTRQEAVHTDPATVVNGLQQAIHAYREKGEVNPALEAAGEAWLAWDDAEEAHWWEQQRQQAALEAQHEHAALEMADVRGVVEPYVDGLVEHYQHQHAADQNRQEPAYAGTRDEFLSLMLEAHFGVEAPPQPTDAEVEVIAKYGLEVPPATEALRNAVVDNLADDLWHTAMTREADGNRDTDAYFHPTPTPDPTATYALRDVDGGPRDNQAYHQAQLLNLMAGVRAERFAAAAAPDRELTETERTFATTQHERQGRQEVDWRGFDAHRDATLALGESMARNVRDSAKEAPADI